MAISDSCPEIPHHQMRGADLPRAAFGLFVLLLRLGQQTLDEVRFSQPRERRHLGCPHDQRLARQRFASQRDRLLLVAAIHCDLSAHGVEFADDARPVLFRAAVLKRLLSCLEPALDLIELVGVLRHPGLQQGHQR